MNWPRPRNRWFAKPSRSAASTITGARTSTCRSLSKNPCASMPNRKAIPATAPTGRLTTPWIAKKPFPCPGNGRIPAGNRSSNTTKYRPSPNRQRVIRRLWTKTSSCGALRRMTSGSKAAALSAKSPSAAKRSTACCCGSPSTASAAKTIVSTVPSRLMRRCVTWWARSAMPAWNDPVRPLSSTFLCRSACGPGFSS